MTGGSERSEPGLADIGATGPAMCGRWRRCCARCDPEMGVTYLDAPPTELVVCTGLDPHSRVLSDACQPVLAEWEPVRLDDYGLARLHADAQPCAAAAWLDAMAPRPARLEASGQTQARPA